MLKLRDLVDKAADADLLREMVGWSIRLPPVFGRVQFPHMSGSFVLERVAGSIEAFRQRGAAGVQGVAPRSVAPERAERLLLLEGSRRGRPRRRRASAPVAVVLGMGAQVGTRAEMGVVNAAIEPVRPQVGLDRHRRHRCRVFHMFPGGYLADDLLEPAREVRTLSR